MRDETRETKLETGLPGILEMALDHLDTVSIAWTINTLSTQDHFHIFLVPAWAQPNHLELVYILASNPYNANTGLQE